MVIHRLCSAGMPRRSWRKRSIRRVDRLSGSNVAQGIPLMTSSSWHETSAVTNNVPGSPFDEEDRLQEVLIRFAGAAGRAGLTSLQWKADRFPLE
jgi:hypothetical protein